MKRIKLSDTGVISSAETASQTDNSTSDKACQTEGPCDTIIVNQIPMNVDYERLVSLFSKYGTVKNNYLCKPMEKEGIKHERMATITFINEEDAWKVWEASQEKLIKYDDHVLMITLVSDNYSPIQNLPDTCLCEIFSRVNRIQDKFHVEMVCKRWKANGRCCWSNITRLQSDDWKINTWRVILSRVRNSLEDVKFILIQDDPNAYEFLRAITEGCVHLRRLTCEFIDVDYSLCAPEITKILQQSRNLCRIQMCFEFADNVNLDFMNVLPVGLVEIHVQVVAEELVTIPSTVALSRFPNLRVVSLDGLRITDQLIANVMNLERLLLCQCNIPDSIFLRILRNNRGLKYLDIGENKLTSAAFRCVQKLPKLQILVVASELIDDYLSGMPRLRGLRCQYCYSLTDVEIRNFLDSAVDLENLCILYCSITLDTTIIARKSTVRTGKSLKLFLDRDLFQQYSAFGWENTDKFEVIKYEESSASSALSVLMEEWALELLD